MITLHYFHAASTSQDVVVDVDPYSIGTRNNGLLPQSVRRINVSLSLEVNSELALFTVQNSSNGLTVTITPLCSDQLSCSAPQSLDFAGVFLPTECSLVSCEYKLVRIDTATGQYLFGVPSIQSVLLLRFLYVTNSRLLKLTEAAVVSTGIERWGCNPTSILQLGEYFYTLCVDASGERLRPLRIDNLNDFGDVSFNPATDDWIMLITFPVPDISVLSQSEAGYEYILLVSGKNLVVIDEQSNSFTITSFPECISTINRLQLRNSSEIDSDEVPYLLYCEQNYVWVNVVDINEPPRQYFYSDTGYPIVCQENDVIITVLTITTNGSNITLEYEGVSIPLPGQDILLDNSMCFGAKENLFFLYTDTKIGTILIDLLEGGIPHYLSDVLCKSTSCTPPRVFLNRYILLEDNYSVDNVTLQLYDTQKQNFVSVARLNYTSSLKHLLEFSQPNFNNHLRELKIIGGTVGTALLIIICILVIALSM